jgi:hypothetical protein
MGLQMVKLQSECIEKISHQVIQTLYKRFKTFPDGIEGIRNAPFHEAFLNAFHDKLKNHVTDTLTFISLSSWFHGLNTTLGQSFFEEVAKILCGGEKREIKGLKISLQQQATIADILTKLKNANCSPDLQTEEKLIYENNLSHDKDIPNFTADCYFEDESEIVAIELKTVRPNSGTFRDGKDTMLLAKCGLKNCEPNKKISYYMAFPFDPFSSTPTGCDKNNFMEKNIDCKKYLAPDEILLADDFWDFLSDTKNTMQQILDIINIIATPQFIDKYNFLNDPQNKINKNDQYKKQLKEWNLFSEIRLCENETILLNKILKDKRLVRKFNQTIFKDGEYNKDRFTALNRFLNL